jgi:hypothetical protein
VDWLADRHVRKRADRVQPCPMAPTWSDARTLPPANLSAGTDGLRIRRSRLLSAPAAVFYGRTPAYATCGSRAGAALNLL